MGKGESMPSKRLRFPFSFFWLFTESWGNKQGLRQSPSNAARGRSMKVRPTQSRKGVKGQLPLAGSRDSVPCGVWGNAPTVPRQTNPKEAANKGAGSEASLPVTLRVRRRALKLLFPQDSVKNQKEETHGRRMEEKTTQSRVNSFSARIGRKKRLLCRIPDCLLMNRGQSLCSEKNQKKE